MSLMISFVAPTAHLSDSNSTKRTSGNHASMRPKLSHFPSFSTACKATEKSAAVTTQGKPKPANTSAFESTKDVPNMVQMDHTKPRPIHRKVKRSDFPPDFLFGASTSALQTEGINGGRGPSTWDAQIRGTTAVDSYHHYKDDVEMLKQMSATSYRFSISWSRILPEGTLRGGINEEGIEFYRNLINELTMNGIEPFVTLCHFDLPQALQDDYNGFLSRRIVNDFKDYANICFQNFGHQVSHWTTFNEPYIFNTDGRYAIGGHFVEHEDKDPYIASHNTILAHAAVAKLYNENYKYENKQKPGSIGMALVASWFLPHNDSLRDIVAAERAFDFQMGWFLEPLLKSGDYPSSMRELVKDRLPYFTDEEKELVKGSCDFIGINYYLSWSVEGLEIDPNAKPVDYHSDQFLTLHSISGPHLGSVSLNPYPQGLKEVLVYIKERYDNPTLYVTENGCKEKRDDDIPPSKAIVDDQRITFIEAHLNYLSQAVRMGVNVKGYSVWSLIDGMESDAGYGERMGLVYIDYLDKLKRIPKKSAKWYGNFITGGIVPVSLPKNQNGKAN